MHTLFQDQDKECKIGPEDQDLEIFQVVTLDLEVGILDYVAAFRIGMDNALQDQVRGDQVAQGKEH